jgi:hypothetical protein
MKIRCAVLAVLTVAGPALAADDEAPTLATGATLRIKAPKTLEIPGLLSAAEGKVTWTAVSVPGDKSRLAARLDGSPELIAVPQPGESLRARLISVDPAGLVVTLERSGERVMIPREAIARLEVSRGPASRPKRALLGAAIGLGVGLALAGVTSAGCEGWGCSTSTAALFGTPLLGLAGGVGGLISPGERWQTFPRDQPLTRSANRPQGGLGVRFSFSF